MNSKQPILYKPYQFSCSIARENAWILDSPDLTNPTVGSITRENAHILCDPHAKTWNPQWPRTAQSSPEQPKTPQNTPEQVRISQKNHGYYLCRVQKVLTRFHRPKRPIVQGGTK